MSNIKAVNHVAVVVDDMEKSLLFWRDALGIELHELRDVPAEKSQVAFLPVAGAEVELVMPTTDDSGIAKYLAKRGPGIASLKVLLNRRWSLPCNSNRRRRSSPRARW